MCESMTVESWEERSNVNFERNAALITYLIFDIFFVVSDAIRPESFRLTSLFGHLIKRPTHRPLLMLFRIDRSERKVLGGLSGKLIVTEQVRDLSKLSHFMLNTYWFT